MYGAKHPAYIHRALMSSPILMFPMPRLDVSFWIGGFMWVPKSFFVTRWTVFCVHAFFVLAYLNIFSPKHRDQYIRHAHPEGCKTKLLQAAALSYPINALVTPAAWHTELPQGKQKLPQVDIRIGTPIWNHHFFNDFNLSIVRFT